jgi:uncharacterized protein (DUF2249 family)
MIDNQLKAEEDIILTSLTQAGMDKEEAGEYLEIIKDKDPAKKGYRNTIIKEVAEMMKRRPCSFQKWYVHEILSKITGLVPGYIDRIVYDPDPASIIKTKA